MVFFATGGVGSVPVTVTVIESLWEPDFAVMVVVPAFFGVTVPLAETVATAVLEELQLTDEPAGSVVAVSFSQRRHWKDQWYSCHR